ncbi:hypothetical protein EV193_103261 [Herbihabitans rhizosphaerae]|uniref:PPE family protein n=1 Tax=Herbihabitans rhizosphaerae TaxID=1872711 RepID=A0A4V2ETG0_9PSEU|nr:hypothetical protein [Herbihabitans rhizosphaerae]RZS40943.1 hypothetical protein EV193_103261 [Herbihabitans rhizosphaerae]
MDPRYRGLGFDPTPGDVDAAAAASAQLGEAARSAAAALPELRRAAEETEHWRGDASAGFRKRVGAHPSTVDSSTDTLLRAARVLGDWVAALTANKRRADELDTKAVALRRELDIARDTLQDKQNALDLAATPATVASASAEKTVAERRVSEVDSKLAEVIRAAHRLESDHRRAADRVAAELEAITSGRAPEPAPDDTRVRALVGVLGRASATCSSLATMLASPDRPAAFTDDANAPTGAAGALAAAVSGNRRS